MRLMKTGDNKEGELNSSPKMKHDGSLIMWHVSGVL